MKPARLIGSLKFRFVALFTLFIVVLCAAISYFFIVDAVKMVSDVFALSGVAIAEKAAKAVDGDSFEKLAQSLDPDDPFYEETRLKLLAIKNETSCEFLYTMAPYRGTVYRFIVDGSAPPDDEENFSALGDEDDVSGYDPAFMECWEKRATVYSGLQYQEGWGWMISIYAPILNSRGNMVGIVGCDYEGESLYIEIRRGIMRQIAIALAFLAAGFGLMVFFLKMIFGRLAILNSLLREISAGEGDFTRRIAALSSDEIGELVGHFNNTMEKLMFLVAGVKDRSASLSISGNELNEDINNVSVAIGEIVSDIATLRERVISQSASATETSATMEQMSRNIDRLNTNVEMQAASVAQSSAAVEEMLANVRSVAQTLAGNAENVGELIKTSEMGRTGLENVSRDIQEIARESEGLLEINSVMENIASQTNLLAMNAAIEAAHAGEAGRGFAVVADEIRKLAVNSSDQSRIIADVLKKIKASIDQITVSAGTVMQEFQAIDGLVRTVSDQEEHIRNAMDEQGQGSQQILAAVGKMNDLSQQVKAGSSEMLEGSKEVIRESKSLETVTQKISGEISRMAANADRINQAALRVDDASRANKRHIDAMASEVSKFKVE